MDNVKETKTWFNVQGKFIIKTTYDPNNGHYHTVRLPWNLLPLPDYVTPASKKNLCESCKRKK